MWGGPLLASGCHPGNMKLMTLEHLCLGCFYKQCGLNPCFTSGCLEFRCTLVRRCLYAKLSIKTMGIESGLPWIETSHTCHCSFIAEGEVSCMWLSWEEKNIKKTAHGILQALSVAFSPCNPSMCSYYIVIINLSCKYNSILNPVSL